MFSSGYFLIIFPVGYLQSLDGRYIMERVFIKVNENIETHIAAGKEERLLTILIRTLGFGCDTFVHLYKRTTSANEEFSGTQNSVPII